MKLEWDENKRNQTLAKRGLDFADVARFDWDRSIYAEDQRYDYGETRYVAFGFIDEILVCLAYTIRQDALRVISLRKASAKERKLYESTTD